MNDWTTIKLTQARQVAELMGTDEDALPEPELPVRQHYEQLRRITGGGREAVSFIGHALPRMEGIAWAARLLDEESRRVDLPRRDRQALDHVLRWLGEPDDTRRRAARDAADTAGDRSPERMLALAVFFSGGSMSQPDLPPVLPPPEASGRMAAGAVTLAGYRSGDAEAFFDRALELAEAIAEQGMRAIPPA